MLFNTWAWISKQWYIYIYKQETCRRSCISIKSLMGKHPGRCGPGGKGLGMKTAWLGLSSGMSSISMLFLSHGSGRDQRSRGLHVVLFVNCAINVMCMYDCKKASCLDGSWIEIQVFVWDWTMATHICTWVSIYTNINIGNMCMHKHLEINLYMHEVSHHYFERFCHLVSWTQDGLVPNPIGT